MFCIPKQLINPLKQQIGENIDNLLKMNSGQRRDFFSKIVQDQGIGLKINSTFEDALTSNKVSALSGWVKKITKEDDPLRSVLQRKVNRLNELGVLTPDQEGNMLEDLIYTRMGVYLTPEEALKSGEIASKINIATESIKDKAFDPVAFLDDMKNKKTNDFLEFFKAHKDLDELVLNAAPTNKVKEAVGSVGRASMLFSFKSPVVNIASNTFQAMAESISRRISNKNVRGLNSDLIKSFRKATTKIYDESGYDISRMISLDNTVAGGGKILGEQLSKPIQATKPFTDLTFNKLMGKPDVVFAAFNFADSADLVSTKMAKESGLKGVALKNKARELMLDAMQVAPKTDEGKLIRTQGIMDATYSTFTNKGAIADATMKMREALNHFGNIGDVLDPFVKTPANVVESGMDYSGLGALKSLAKYVTTRGDRKVLGFTKPEDIREITNGLVRTGVGLTSALLISNLVPIEDFVGAYDPTRLKYDELKNSNTNAIRIGDKWISLDYFGALAAPLTGILYAKKFGKDAGFFKKVGLFGSGFVEQAKRIPVLGTIGDTFGGVTDAVKTEEGIGMENVQQFGQFITSQLASRMIPGLVGDIGNITDAYARDTNTKKYSWAGINWDKFIARLPKLRESLPIKQTLTGEEVRGEEGALGAITELIAGSRVKTYRQTEAGKEILRLKDTGNKPEITNWNYITSAKQKELKDRVGEDKYHQIFKDEYGQQLRDGIDNLVKNDRYQGLPDEEKKRQIDTLENDIIAKIYDRYKIGQYTERKKPIKKLYSKPK